MAVEITVPKLGWSMDEGTFVEWLKKDGDEVKPGDLLFALESDKAIQEIESLDSGILRIPPNGPQKDEVVKVGQVLGYMVAPGEELSGEANVPSASADIAPKSTARHKPANKDRIVTASSAPEELSAPRTVNAPAVSPRAARLAMEKGVDLCAVTGTGKNGRITEKDVIAVKSGATVAGLSKSQPEIGSSEAPRGTCLGGADRQSRKPRGIFAEPCDLSAEAIRAKGEARDTIPPSGILAKKGQTIQLTAVRRTIAERMLKSHSATAPVTLTMQVNASELVNFRHQLKTTWPKDSVPTYNDLFIKISALALREHPGLNTKWEGDQIVFNDAVNIGIAVETDSGLLVPVLRDVPDLGLRELAAKTRDLAERVRQRKLSPDECSGGTFTVTNLGSAGVDAFTPIINYPECAVLGVGRILLQPAVNESGAIVSRHMVWLSLTFDHRIIDGAPAARFLDTVRKYVENPDKRMMQ